ncbi:hypothetical protein [Leptospira noguchii]|uniref:hypothetical protein n=1 Tax=Leptospira noguchii TaxID=28182 RepID=UPI003D76A256
MFQSTSSQTRGRNTQIRTLIPQENLKFQSTPSQTRGRNVYQYRTCILYQSFNPLPLKQEKETNNPDPPKWLAIRFNPLPLKQEKETPLNQIFIRPL